MAILEHEGMRPKIDPTARIAPTATVCGDVTVAEQFHGLARSRHLV